MPQNMRNDKVQRTANIYRKNQIFNQGAAHRPIYGRGNMEPRTVGTDADFYDGYDLESS
jgi:hypothetical protein